MSQVNTIFSLLQRRQAAIMGIINTTPDSFSDGGLYNTAETALKHALRLVGEGADILDVGGESTRPGADKVSLQQELDRVIPVVERIHNTIAAPISIDTHKPKVMREALRAGATMVNDVNALRTEGAIEVVAQHNVPVCIMHMAGQPKTMQQKTSYSDVIGQVVEFLMSRIDACLEAGIDLNNLVVDPGIGFGKKLEHNLQLLQNTAVIAEQTGCQVLIGVSRKSMIDGILSRPVEQRLHASVALAVQAVLNGAKIVRVHDVRATYDAIRSVEAVLNA
ncbi:MAG: dihydropteroate synthase [Cryomorphaceae bacterium]|jgi:dihydropteroate synthase